MQRKLFIFLEIWIICMTLFSTLQCHTNRNNVEKNPSRELLQITGDPICKLNFTFIFDIRLNPDKNAITLHFELDDHRFKDCFTFCDVFLKSQGKTVQEKRVSYRYDENKVATCVFENVFCGTYQLFVEPFFTDLSTDRLFLKSNVVHMRSNDCEIDNKIIIFSAIGCVILILVSGVLVHRFCCSGRNNACYNQTSSKNINVYILHYSNNIMKNKVSILKDFLQQSLYCSSIKTIEDDLSTILINPYDWISSIIEETDKDGNLNKIILIKSEDDYEEEEYEMENFIFSEFNEKLRRKSFWCLSRHNSIFVAKLREEISYVEKLKNLLRQHHYHIPKHLTDLCLKLCEGSELDVSRVKRKLKKILVNHQVEYLCSDPV